MARVPPLARFMILSILVSGCRSVGTIENDTRPAVPTNHVYPRDTLFVVADPIDSSLLYYRRLLAVTFVDSASGATVRAFFARYSARVVAGIPVTDSYIVQIPDPGPSWSQVQAHLTRMSSAEGVLSIMPLVRREPQPQLR